MTGPDRNGRHWLVRLYPHAWRERYGDELDALLETEKADLRLVIDLLRASAAEWIWDPSGLGGLSMTYRNDVAALVRKPSGFTPLIMSTCALLLLLGFLAVAVMTGGIERHEDEGVGARLYQVLIFGQVFLIAWFALRWGRRDLKAAVPVLALQVLAILVTFLPLWYFGM